MAKKERIEIRRDENLADIDAELDDALDKLEAANVRIGELLGTIEQGTGGAQDNPPEGKTETKEMNPSPEEAG